MGTWNHREISNKLRPEHSAFALGGMLHSMSRNMNYSSQILHCKSEEENWWWIITNGHQDEKTTTGKGAMESVPSKQRTNTGGSTNAETVVADDSIARVVWTK